MRNHKKDTLYSKKGIKMLKISKTSLKRTGHTFRRPKQHKINTDRLFTDVNHAARTNMMLALKSIHSNPGHSLSHLRAQGWPQGTSFSIAPPNVARPGGLPRSAFINANKDLNISMPIGTETQSSPMPTKDLMVPYTPNTHIPDPSVRQNIMGIKQFDFYNYAPTLRVLVLGLNEIGNTQPIGNDNHVYKWLRDQAIQNNAECMDIIAMYDNSNKSPMLLPRDIPSETEIIDINAMQKTIDAAGTWLEKVHTVFAPCLNAYRMNCYNPHIRYHVVLPGWEHIHMSYDGSPFGQIFSNVTLPKKDQYDMYNNIDINTPLAKEHVQKMLKDIKKGKLTSDAYHEFADYIFENLKSRLSIPNIKYNPTQDNTYYRYIINKKKFYEKRNDLYKHCADYLFEIYENATPSMSSLNAILTMFNMLSRMFIHFDETKSTPHGCPMPKFAMPRNIILLCNLSVCDLLSNFFQTSLNMQPDISIIDEKNNGFVTITDVFYMFDDPNQSKTIPKVLMQKSNVKMESMSNVDIQPSEYVKDMAETLVNVKGADSATVYVKDKKRVMVIELTDPVNLTHVQSTDKLLYKYLIALAATAIENTHICLLTGKDDISTSSRKFIGNQPLNAERAIIQTGDKYNHSMIDGILSQFIRCLSTSSLNCYNTKTRFDYYATAVDILDIYKFRLTDDLKNEKGLLMQLFFKALPYIYKYGKDFQLHKDYIALRDYICTNTNTVPDESFLTEENKMLLRIQRMSNQHKMDEKKVAKKMEEIAKMLFMPYNLSGHIQCGWAYHTLINTKNTDNFVFLCKYHDGALMDVLLRSENFTPQFHLHSELVSNDDKLRHMLNVDNTNQIVMDKPIPNYSYRKNDFDLFTNKTKYILHGITKWEIYKDNKNMIMVFCPLDLTDSVRHVSLYVNLPTKTVWNAGFEEFIVQMHKIEKKLQVVIVQSSPQNDQNLDMTISTPSNAQLDHIKYLKRLTKIYNIKTENISLDMFQMTLPAISHNDMNEIQNYLKEITSVDKNYFFATVEFTLLLFIKNITNITLKDIKDYDLTGTPYKIEEAIERIADHAVDYMQTYKNKKVKFDINIFIESLNKILKKYKIDLTRAKVLNDTIKKITINNGNMFMLFQEFINSMSLIQYNNKDPIVYVMNPSDAEFFNYYKYGRYENIEPEQCFKNHHSPWQISQLNIKDMLQHKI